MLPRRHKDQRKIKHRINQLANKLKYGTYFINCNSYPCRITKANIYSDKWVTSSDIDGINIITGEGTSCSILHCAPQPISREQAYLMREDIIKLDYAEYTNKYQYNNTLSEEDLKQIRLEIANKNGYLHSWNQGYNRLVEHLKITDKNKLPV